MTWCHEHLWRRGIRHSVPEEDNSQARVTWCHEHLWRRGIRHSVPEEDNSQATRLVSVFTGQK
ncbi:hypothetical protein [Streptomyces sp. enrichment culture]|uniref:hypothetical protein n=1 Tax=Streptomyces sp. enrichment culture TaxID=1795815 RepID=UPI003F546C5D